MAALARQDADRAAPSPAGEAEDTVSVDMDTGIAVKAEGQTPAPAQRASPLVTSMARVANTTPRAFRDLLALDDFERHAKRRLPHMIFQYVQGGVETGTAMRQSRAAYSDYAFLPRMMVDTSARSCATELFGKTYAAPFGIGPLGGSAFIAYRGDLVLAEAAGAQNIPMILSASSLIKLEDVHAQNRDAWYQGYLPGDQNRIDRLIDRVERTGYETFVVTADTPTLGNREHNARSGFSMPIKVTPKVLWQSATHPRWALGVVAQTFIKHGVPHFENTEAERGPPMMSQNAVRNTIARDKLCWANLEAIRRRWKGSLLVKGLLNPADVEIARSCGADGVILSTHGGRQLDHAIAPLDVLPEIAANKGSMKVIVDSGIRRGTDVLKAVSLGADFVLLGRPFLFAAALGGAPCVSHAIGILREEILRDMAFLGANRLDELGPEILRKVERRV